MMCHVLRHTLFLLILSLSTTSASAQCRMAAAGSCTVVPATQAPPPVAIGELIPRGKYSMVMDATWYGLPPARNGWIYYRIARDVYRVDYTTMEVLERATSETSRNWP